MSKQAKVDVILNTEQAKAALKEVQAELKQVKTLRDKAFESGDITGYNQLNTQFKKLTSEAGKLEKQAKDVNDIFKNLSSASIRELQGAYNQLNRELNQMKRNDPGYAAKQKDVKLLRTELNAATDAMKVHQSGISRLADGVNKYFALLTAGAATAAGFIMGARRAVDVFNLFEERVDNLSALTGLLGDDLDWLSNEAKKLSTSVIEGNVRIRSSATEIVDAYTKVGSKRPELLLVKEDLNAVTKEAMILSSAAKSDLQPAVDGLTMVLNQFNAPASESRRIINVLAAGSKVGAGEIAYLTSGFEKSGSVANSFNISIEELTGALETLAPRISEPEIAGRSLRNIMIKLETQANDKLKPSLVGLNGAFEYMAKQQYTVAQLTEMFGTENINAANILMNNTAETKKYTEAVTGTNVALEQAAINTDNNATKLQQAKNKVEILTMEFGQKLAPAMTFSTNTFGYFMKAVMAAPEFLSRYSTAITAVVGLTLAYNAAVLKSISLKAIDFIWNGNLIAQFIRYNIVGGAQLTLIKLKNIWTSEGTIITKAAATAQYLWNAAINANPIGLIIVAITALVVAIKTYSDNNAESIRLEKEKADALNSVKRASENLQSAYENYKVVIGELNKLNIEQKKNLLEQVDATLKAAEAELTLAEAKQKNIEKDNTRATTWQKFVNSLVGYNNPGATEVLNVTDAVKNGLEAAETMNDGIKQLRDNIKSLREQSNGLNEIVNAEKLADAITGKSGAELEEKQRYLTTALKNYEKGTQDYIRISKKLSEVTRQMQTDDGSGGPASVLQDAFQALGKKISDLDAQINNAIASGNTPLAQKFIIEKKAAEDLLEAYKKIKEAVSQGWDLDQRDQGKIEALVSVGSKLVKSSGKPSKKIKLTKRNQDSNEDLENRGRSVEADIKQREDDAAKIKEAEFAIATSINNAVFDIVRNRQQAEFDHKMKLLNLEREKELSNKNLTEEQKAAINEKYAKKEADLKIKQFKKEQNASALQALINGALAITKTFAFYGFTPAGWAAASAQAVATLAEIAVIKSAKPPEYYEGGYTDQDIDDKKPAGIVHANEFIGSAKAVRNPSVKKVLDIIDYAQRSGTISQINLPAVIAADASIKGHYNGGYTSAANDSPRVVQPTATSIGVDPIQVIRDNNALIRHLIDKGVQTNFSLFEHEKAKAKLTDIRNAVDM